MTAHDDEASAYADAGWDHSGIWRTARRLSVISIYILVALMYR
jgi:hypothetical protein